MRAPTFAASTEVSPHEGATTAQNDPMGVWGVHVHQSTDKYAPRAQLTKMPRPWQIERDRAKLARVGCLGR
jgi:hypothetical protein